MSLEHLQIYWWLLISVLGALLVFLLFVQGGQSMLLTTKNNLYRNLMVNSIGTKWELTFTLSFPFLPHQFRWRILALDSDFVYVCRAGGELSVS